jgi:hypothetical protein
MRRILLLPLLLVGVLGQGAALAATIFEATLTGGQEVPPVATTASGSATLILNDPMDRLEIFVQLAGLDLDGNQTPGDTDDDIIAMHIHAAPAGVNGPVVFGFISPDSDTNGDLVIDPVAGTLFSGWDLNEGFGTTLDSQLTNLFNAGLYVNVHTNAFSAGEIRGQILAAPIPGTAALLLLGLTLLRRRRC